MSSRSNTFYGRARRVESHARIADSDITICLQALNQGDSKASDELLPLVYDELRRHAASRMASESNQQTLQPTALVHEAWLRLEKGKRETKWENRSHFFGAAARAMRRILIENARRKSRIKRGGDQSRVCLDDIDLAASAPEDRIVLIEEALERLEMEDPEKAQVVTLKFFGGHTNQEVAQAMNLSERTIERHWAYAKAWLFKNMATSH